MGPKSQDKGIKYESFISPMMQLFITTSSSYQNLRKNVRVINSTNNTTLDNIKFMSQFNPFGQILQLSSSQV